MLWRFEARVLSLAGAVGALLLLGACSAPPPAADPLPATSVTSPAAGHDNGSGIGSGIGGQPAGGDGKNDGGSLAWVPPGPADIGDPPPSQWYVLLLNKDCAGLVEALGTEEDSGLDGYALWSAAAAVCRAVHQGDDSGWTEAAARLPGLARPEPGDCLNRAAYNFVAAFVAFHAQNPAAVPSPLAGSGTACPLGLTGLLDIGDPGTTSAPSSGLAGGQFQLAGHFLDVAAVLVDGQPVLVEPAPGQRGHWIVVIPPASAPGTVQVNVESSAGPLPGSVTFTYLNDAPETAASQPPVPPEAPRDGAGTAPEAPSSAPETSAGGG